MRITEAQSQAIAHGDGPAMVLAGPGSGKTLVITQRARYLIDQYHVKPQEILVITFTRAAAQEMKSRFVAAGGRNGVTFGTFHSVFFTILKHAYHFTPANIINEEQKYRMLSQLVRETGMQLENEKELLPDLIAEISQVKNDRIMLEYYYSRSCPEEVFRSIFSRYEAWHRENGLLDFDDILTYTWELLRARPDICDAWRRRFRYILVDEFQDINLLQYEIVRLLAAPTNNLFIVGDDDQSIYRFRGARPEIMLNFPKDYPDARQFILDFNFRSVPPVISSAGLVITENTHRFEKRIRAVRTGGNRIDLREFDNQNHESLYLVKCIRESMERGIPGSQIAVLYRSNQGAGPFAERLMEFNLPFEMHDTLPNIYEHWIAKDLLAYMHLAKVQMDREQFLLVMNRPKRYLSRNCIDEEIVSFASLENYYKEKDWMLDRIDRLELDLKLIRNMAPYAAINYIRHGIQYETYLQEYAKAHRMRVEEFLDILDEIQQGAKPYRTYEEWIAHIEEYRQTLSEKRQKRERQEDAVMLSTLHSSKGLEFTEVFLVDVNDGVIPHRKATVEADFEEERRLLYVGMTRAKEHLHLFYCKERYGKSVDPSPFIENLLCEQL